MLRIITFELQKVWGKQIFISLLTTLFITNVFLLWYTHQENDTTIPLSAYHAYHNDLSLLPNDQRMTFIQQYYDDVKGLELVENVKQYESWQSEQGLTMANACIENNKDTYLKYLPLWESNNFLKYTNNIEQEILFAQEIYKEAYKVSHYEDFLKDIETTSDTLNDISIFFSIPPRFARGHKYLMKLTTSSLFCAII